MSADTNTYHVESEQTVNTHYFRYNLNTIVDPLERVQYNEFEEDEQKKLKEKQYKKMQINAPAHIEFYESNYVIDAKYLAIMRIDHYRFFFYIIDDNALIHWRKRFEQLLPNYATKQLLPPEPTLPQYQTFEMNLKTALYKR